MTQIRFLLLLLLIAIFSYSHAGDNITKEQLAGTWKITDVKIIPLGTSGQALQKDKCYLCDLYKAGLGLVFTVEGEVNYSNYGNPNSVRYDVADNVITLFTAEDTERNDPETNRGLKKKQETSVDFIASLNGEVLTLIYTSATGTETYTFTK